LSGSIYKYTQKWYITEELMVKWLGKVWDRGTGASLKKRRTLVLEHFKGHIT
jgi:hypothetical protein